LGFKFFQELSFVATMVMAWQNLHMVYHVVLHVGTGHIGEVLHNILQFVRTWLAFLASFSSFSLCSLASFSAFSSGVSSFAFFSLRVRSFFDFFGLFFLLLSAFLVSAAFLPFFP
jgi:cellulose synthase/poly-beta-1,6-N-acetylglucosamine synthase-like glycosyltransferase